MDAPATGINPAARASRIRRTAALLGTVAVAFYIGSIALLVWRSRL